MFRCRLCDRWWTRQWEKSYDWERVWSNESELWEAEPAANRDLIERAGAIRDSEPEAAFKLYVEGAEAGCAHALETVGWHYSGGHVVEADWDRAVDHYRRAIGAGSWMATIEYARLLAERGFRDEWESVLEDGVRLDFVPASFWLAHLRYRQDESNRTAKAVRPLLDYAAGEGHPLAQITLMRWMTLGRLGLRAIPSGIGLGFRLARAEAKEEGRRPAASAR